MSSDFFAGLVRIALRTKAERELIEKTEREITEEFALLHLLAEMQKRVTAPIDALKEHFDETVWAEAESRAYYTPIWMSFTQEEKEVLLTISLLWCAKIKKGHAGTSLHHNGIEILRALRGESTPSQDQWMTWSEIIDLDILELESFRLECKQKLLNLFERLHVSGSSKEARQELIRRIESISPLFVNSEKQDETLESICDFMQARLQSLQDAIPALPPPYPNVD